VRFDSPVDLDRGMLRILPLGCEGCNQAFLCINALWTMTQQLKKRCEPF